MWQFEEELRELEKRRIPWRDSTVRPVLFYGSSSFRFWEASEYTSFKGPFLQEALALSDAVNLGFGGATIQACVYLFERIIVPFRPRALLVYAGDNDLALGSTVAEIVNGYRYLIAKTRHYCGPIPITVLSIKPSPAYHSNLNKIVEANSMISEVVASQADCYFLDVFHPMMNGEQPDRSFFEADGIHMNAKGYQLWAEVLRLGSRSTPIFGAETDTPTHHVVTL